MARHGPGVLSDTELLSMLLRSGSKDLDVLSLATQIIAEANSLSGLLTWTEADFRRMKGIGPIKSLQLLAVMEMAKRILIQRNETPLELSTPETIYNYFQNKTAGLEVEKVWVINLNRKNHLINTTEIASGSASISVIQPRDVFREAVRAGACAVVCVHNHPSGDPTPSKKDVTATLALEKAAEAIQITLLGHIIMGRPTVDPRGYGFYSFAESGMMHKE